MRHIALAMLLFSVLCCEDNVAEDEPWDADLEQTRDMSPDTPGPDASPDSREDGDLLADPLDDGDQSMTDTSCPEADVGTQGPCAEGYICVAPFIPFTSEQPSCRPRCDDNVCPSGDTCVAEHEWIVEDGIEVLGDVRYRWCHPGCNTHTGTECQDPDRVCHIGEQFEWKAPAEDICLPSLAPDQTLEPLEECTEDANGGWVRCNDNAVCYRELLPENPDTGRTLCYQLCGSSEEYPFADTNTPLDEAPPHPDCEPGTRCIAHDARFDFGLCVPW